MTGEKQFPFNILVFPCGSEVALEIHRSLCYSRHINLIGASSTNDHGRFVFQNYIGDLPFITDQKFINKLASVCKDNKIDAIFPAMDSVLDLLKKNEQRLNCKVIASHPETTRVCLSKKKTYEVLKENVAVPRLYNSVDEIDTYPVFLKPDVGYGSRGVKKCNTRVDVLNHLSTNADNLILEWLPGKEYTVDCFSDVHGNLLYAGMRPRRRIMNGISVNTITTNEYQNDVMSIANAINDKLKFTGAWFFQLKENTKGKLTLLEVASRMGGSSAAYRIKGINFALLSVFTHMQIPVDILENNYTVELDRALSNSYHIPIFYNEVYVDLDDCLILGNHINNLLVSFLHQCINNKIKIILLTKHEADLNQTLNKHRISQLFDQIIHIKKTDEKSNYIKTKDAIFIDDSHVERKKISANCNIPVFSPDMVEGLLKFY
jgi:hypothetical protein